MSILSRRVDRLAARLRGFAGLVAGFRGLDAEQREMRDEMRFHLDMHTRAGVARGLAPHDATRAARLAFGGEAQWSETARDEVRSRLLDDLWRDARYAAGVLRRAPGFAIATVGTI